jgi:hypothetical protein
VANEKEGEDGALKHQPNGKSTEEIATNSMQPEEKDIVKKNDIETSVASGAPKEKEGVEGKETTGLVAGDEKEQGNSISSTFAFSDGAEFTDAGLDVSNKCPIAGCWKGYFENVSVSGEMTFSSSTIFAYAHPSRSFYHFYVFNRGEKIA